MSYKILVVEDTPDSRILLAYYLKLEGYEVVDAEDGLEGLQKARAERPHLIITDLHMPNLNGIEMIRQVRTLGELASVGIIALTAYGDEVVTAAREVGADVVLEKPALPEVVCKAVRQLLTGPDFDNRLAF